MYKLVLLRHGESTWNLENRFAGWTDVDLTPTGIQQAKNAGARLDAEGFHFDVCYVSVLKRAIHTLQYCLTEMDLSWLPVVHSWRLNERHYGALQGLNKAETARKYGDDQVLAWRRSYDVAPPALDEHDPRWEHSHPRYAALSAEQMPRTESLKDTVDRILPFWNQAIAPDIRSGKRVLVAAHGNSIRALMKHIDRTSDTAIVGVNIPNGIPLVYELDADLHPLRHYYLAGTARSAPISATVTPVEH